MLKDVMGNMDTLDRDALMKRMVKELPLIGGEMDLTAAALAHRAGIEPKRYKEIEAGRRGMKWSEYMSLLFVLWSDERSRERMEDRGLFPEELKAAMSVNRNKHGEG